VRGASIWHLVVWLTTFSSVWAALVWAFPRVTKMFERRRQPLPVPTSTLLTLERFSRSSIGALVAVALVAASIYVFVRFRERPFVRRVLIAMTTLGLGLVLYLMFGALLPLVNMARV